MTVKGLKDKIAELEAAGTISDDSKLIVDQGGVDGGPDGLTIDVSDVYEMGEQGADTFLAFRCPAE